MTKHSNTLLYVLLIMTMATWGLSWTNGKILSEYCSSSILAFWRFFLSSIFMIPVLLVTRKSIKVNAEGIKYIIIGSILIFSYNIFFFMGTNLGYANVGGVFVPTLNPIITFILSILFFRVKIFTKDSIGLVFGIIGGIIVLEAWNLSNGQMTANGNLFFLFASISWGIMSIVSGKSHDKIDTLTFSFWVYFIASLFCLLVNINNNILVVIEFDFIFWFNIITLSIGAQVFGTTVYFIATTKLGPPKASSFIFLVPITAPIFSMFLIGEELGINTVIGGLMTMTAVYLINKEKIQTELND
ncbi:MAG: DMT family transporter [Candidatus Neomarinimicrobiota bacterium]|nr:DMT family transporter [Candidatus Neomarinimicrobiota bacterium]